VEDTTPWVEFTGWNKLFLGKDIVLISETRLAKSVRMNDLFQISEERLEFVGKTLDSLIARCLETLETTPRNVCRWLGSYKKMEPGARPFDNLLRDGTVKM